MIRIYQSTAWANSCDYPNESVPPLDNLLSYVEMDRVETTNSYS